MSNNDIKFRLKINLQMDKTYLIKEFQTIIFGIQSENKKTSPFRIKQYSDIIKLIQTYPNEKIENLDRIKEWFIKNGKKNPDKMISKIEQFSKKGYIDEAKKARSNNEVLAVMKLTKVANIGPAKAKELYNKYGIITVEDLKDKFKKDNTIIHNKQKIGLLYYDDLLKRIPRQEMDMYNDMFSDICKFISPDMKFSINGSYRRKHSTSGDIDVLISGPKGKNKLYRNKFLEELKTRKIVREVLASGTKKFMGITILPGCTIHRHLDVIDTDIDQYPFAQLYFTGSGGFNSHMRLLALKKGYSLNEYCISDKKTKKAISENIIFEKLKKHTIDTEEDIFRFLEMNYIVPELRNTMTLSKLL